jgi:hypothetical protein
MKPLTRLTLAAAAIALSACAPQPPSAAVDATPVMRWDFHPQAPAWTAATLRALEGEGAALVDMVPADIEIFCPGYAAKGPEERAAFWAGLFSALAKHESTWNPAAAGGGGRWIGLLQISPQTAGRYGCDADTARELKDGASNLSCAVRIAAAQVARDRVVAGGGSRGIGRDWAPFRSSGKREDIASWTRQQSYCRAG